MDGIQILTTGPEPLQTDQCKATLVLRLGAALNSLRAAQRWTLKEHGDGPAGQLDRFQAYIIAAAYLAEACKLFWQSQSCIVELARAGGAEQQQIDEFRKIADPTTGVQADLLKWIRDKVTFHWDCDVFEQWASNKKRTVTWFKTIGGTNRESVMWASHEAIVEFAASRTDQSRPLEERIKDQVSRVAEVSKQVANVFEDAVKGFLKGHGANQETEEPDSPA
jgi:hypothetical protein